MIISFKVGKRLILACCAVCCLTIVQMNFFVILLGIKFAIDLPNVTNKLLRFVIENCRTVIRGYNTLIIMPLG